MRFIIWMIAGIFYMNVANSQSLSSPWGKGATVLPLAPPSLGINEPPQPLVWIEKDGTVKIDWWVVYKVEKLCFSEPERADKDLCRSPPSHPWMKDEDRNWDLMATIAHILWAIREGKDVSEPPTVLHKP